MTDITHDADMATQFEAMAAAFKRQFRLDLVIAQLDNPWTIRVTDEQGSGDVKYLGTLRSNWLRRNAKRFGFRSIGHELYPEVAGGAYIFEAGVQKDSDDIEEITVIEDATLHSVGVVPGTPEDPSFVVVHDDPPADEEESPYRERFLDS